ncbi:MAG: diguanylate cyclase [Pseudomonadota bacterium]
MPLSASIQLLCRWAGTLKFKIVLMAVVTAVAAAAGSGMLTLARTQAGIERLLLDSAADDRQRTAALLTSKVGLLRDTLRAVAHKLPPDAWGDAQAMALALQDKLVINALFDTVYAATPSGQMLARLEKGQPMAELPNVADRDYFQQVLKSDQPVISSALRGKVSNAPLVIFAVPALDVAGNVVGVLAGSLALQSSGLFLEMRADGSGEGSRDLVIDRHGLILSHPDQTRVMQPAAHEPGLVNSMRTWLASGSPIDTVGVARIDDGHLVSSAGIPLTDWVHVRLTPTSLAFRPLAAARVTTWQSAAGVGLLAGLLAGALAWSMTRPISRLRARADALLQPGLVAGAWPVEAGEVGALSRAFETVVAQREQGQSEARALLVQLQAVLDHAEVGIAFTRNGQFVLVSRQFCQVFQCDKADLLGRPTRQIYASDDALAALAAQARPAFMAQGAFDTELELVRHGGQPFWARMRGRAVAPGDLGQGTIWTIEDVTAARAQREHLQYSASHDVLTGLANRRAFEAALAQATEAAASAPFCLLLIDLDRFKRVNDIGGHAAGDQMLQQVAKLIEARVRQTDLAARLGGDEFAVLLAGCPPAQAQRLAEALCAEVNSHVMHWQGQQHSVGASIGMVLAQGRQTQPAELLRAADAACYAAKHQGRNQVVVHQQEPVAQLQAA